MLAKFIWRGILVFDFLRFCFFTLEDALFFYVGDGVKGLLKDGGSKRRAVVEKLFKSMGGTIESFYYAFGETDLFVIGDFPDNASVAAAALTTVSTGTVTTKTTVLITP